MTCKWLILIMVNKSPKDRVVGPLPNGLNRGDPNHLLTGMILQVVDIFI